MPRNGQVLGIAFAVDQAGGGLASVIAVMFAATMVFAWGYFDEVHSHFHVLMLLFMAGMIGFCLTHDVFNMFVWFEVMSVAAYALTGYALQAAPLEGALNFTVLNTIGSYLLLGGIGLLYAVAGALDMGALGAAVARAPGDPVVGAAFVLMATGAADQGGAGALSFLAARCPCGGAQPGLGHVLRRHGIARHLRADAHHLRRVRRLRPRDAGGSHAAARAWEWPARCWVRRWPCCSVTSSGCSHSPRSPMSGSC